MERNRDETVTGKNSENIFIEVEREREQVELSRILHERSRGRGNGAANENGSRQGKLIRSGAMTREKLRSEMDERLSLSLPPSVPFPVHLLFFSIFLRFLASKEAKDIKEISNLSDQRVLFVRREGLQFLPRSSPPSYKFFSSIRREKGETFYQERAFLLDCGLILG